MAKLCDSEDKCYRNWEYRQRIAEKGFVEEMEIGRIYEQRRLKKEKEHSK